MQDPYRPGAVAAPEAVVRQAYDSVARGLNPGMQVYASLGRKVVADLVVGAAGEGEPLETGTRVPWLSGTKPVVAVALGRLHTQGSLDLDDPVTRFVPEFADYGKAEVRISDLLAHAVPFVRDIPLAAVIDGWDSCLDAACGLELAAGAPVGRVARYTAFAAWQVLGEVVQRVADEPLPAHLARTIFEPLGMASCSLGLPATAPAASVCKVLDRRSQPATTGAFVTSDTYDGRALPGMGGLGPMRELGRFYETLCDVEGARSALGIDAPTLQRMTSTARSGYFDRRYGSAVDWGLGFITDRRIFGGNRLTRDVFGHDGRLCSVSFCDRGLALVVCIMATALVDGTKNAMRFRRVTDAVLDEIGAIAPVRPRQSGPRR